MMSAHSSICSSLMINGGANLQNKSSYFLQHDLPCPMHHDILSCGIAMVCAQVLQS
jgi:hypothetical protein